MARQLAVRSVGVAVCDGPAGSRDRHGGSTQVVVMGAEVPVGADRPDETHAVDVVRRLSALSGAHEEVRGSRAGVVGVRGRARSVGAAHAVVEGVVGVGRLAEPYQAVALVIGERDGLPAARQPRHVAVRVIADREQIARTVIGAVERHPARDRGGLQIEVVVGIRACASVGLCDVEHVAEMSKEPKPDVQWG